MAEQTRTFIQNLLMVQSSFRQAIQRNLKKNNIDLTFEMLQIMVHLWKKDGINQQEIATKTFKDKASLTYLINNLTTRGLVFRQEDPIDRRNNNIYLTELGGEYGRKVKPMLQEIYKMASEKIDSSNFDVCINYLHDLDNAFKDI
ncbi:MAG: MarR family winged helix-turn-helix transcriptional regulator [Rikenellaceae bacterium]